MKHFKYDKIKGAPIQFKSTFRIMRLMEVNGKCMSVI